MLNFLLYVLTFQGQLTADETAKLHENMQPSVTKCLDEFGITKEKVAEGIPRNDLDPCLLACIFKGEKVVRT